MLGYHKKVKSSALKFEGKGYDYKISRLLLRLPSVVTSLGLSGFDRILESPQQLLRTNVLYV